MLPEMQELKEKKKQLESELNAVESKIWRIQKECKHPKGYYHQGPEPSLTDWHCPDCDKSR